MAQASTPSHSARVVTRTRIARLARRTALATGVITALVAAGLAADYFLPQDGEPSEQRDALGRLERFETGTGEVKLIEHHPAGFPTEVRYARRGRLTKLLYPTTRTVRAEFDRALRRVALEDPTGLTAFEHDEFALLSSVTDPSGLRIAYQRGPWGEARTIEIPNGRKLRYRYDANLRPTRIEDGDVAITYEYDDLRGELVRRLPNGISTLVRIGDGGRITLIRHARAGTELILELRYQHDDDGRIVRREEVTPAGTKSWKFQYDALGRLVREEGPDGPTLLAWDPDGNLTSREHPRGVTRYAYERGQLVRETRHEKRDGGLELVDEIGFEYGRFGELLAKRGTKGTTRYEWNIDRQLVRVETDAGEVLYKYNGDGLRTGRRARGDVTHYVHHLDGVLPQVLVEHDGDAHIAHDILGLDRVGRRQADGSLEFYLEDHQRSTRVVVDAKGNTLARYEYSEFGVPKRVEGTSEAAYLYTGEAWDADAGLLFLRNRYYDPESARFVSPDPHPPSLENPQSLNRYAYVEGDPINKIDPTGLQPWLPPPPPPPPPTTFYDPNRELWRMLNLHREVPSVQLFRPMVLPPPIYDPVRVPDLRLGPMFTPQAAQPRWWSPDAPVGGALRTGVDLADYFTDETRFPSAPPALRRIVGPVDFAFDVFDTLYYANQGRAAHAVVAANPIWLAFVPVVGPELALAASLIPAEDQIIAARAVGANARAELGQGNFGRFLALPFTLAHTAVARALVPSDFRIDGRDSSLDAFRAVPARGLDTSGRGFLPPPPPPGGPGSPLPGGVWIDQTAKILGDLGTITGAVFDRESGRLVLTGDRTRTFPPMKPEYLAAAIRAVYSPCREAPGMTIDPHPQDPRGPTMLVRFFCAQHTELGYQMFESDRLLKALSTGRDNVSRAPATSSVPGYRSVAERKLDDTGSFDGLWSRFWIVPEPVTAKATEDGILFDPIRLRLKTETMLWGNGKLVPAGGRKDPVAEDFAAHFTEHYDAFAREHAAFAELKVVTLAVAVARWMKENDVPADWGFVASALAEPYPTPTTTPSAFNEVSRSINGGVQTVQVIGGVEMQPKLAAVRDAETGKVVKQILEAVDKIPDGEPKLAKVEILGREQAAAALPSSTVPPLGTFDSNEQDLMLPTWTSELGDIPGLARHYSSVDGRSRELGRWSLELPRLERESDPETSEGQVRMIGFEGMKEMPLERYALTHRGRVVRFVRPFADSGLGRVGFAPEPGGELFRGIFPEGDDLYRVIYRSGEQVLFDGSGGIRALFRGDASARYGYRDDGRLDSIDLARGDRKLAVRFERDAQRRIRAMSAGDERVDYVYDGAGDLTQVRGRRSVGYRHDSSHRPTEIVVDGKVIRRQKFDAAGRIVEIGGEAGSVEQSFAATPAGLTVTRKTPSGTERTLFDAKRRPTRVEHANGAVEEHEYAGESLKRTTTTLPGGGRASIEYSPNGSPRLVRDASGTTTDVHYLPDGRPSEVLVNGAAFASLDYGATGVERIRYRGGYEERVERDHEGRVVAVARLAPEEDANDPARWTRFTPSRPAGETPRVEEDSDSRPTQIESPDGTRSKIAYAADGAVAAIEMAQGDARRSLEIQDRTVTFKTSDGRDVRYVFDDSRRVTAVRDAAGRSTSYAYEPRGGLASIRLPSGRVVACRGARGWECGW